MENVFTTDSLCDSDGGAWILLATSSEVFRRYCGWIILERRR